MKIEEVKEKYPHVHAIILKENPVSFSEYERYFQLNFTDGRCPIQIGKNTIDIDSVPDFENVDIYIRNKKIEGIKSVTINL